MSMFSKFFEHPAAKAVGAVVLGACIALAGAVFSDYSSFLSKHREEVAKQYSESKDLENRVIEDIQALSVKLSAVPVVSLTASDKDSLKKNLSTLYQRASDVSRSIPETLPEFQRYGHAMLDLQHAAVDVSGPGDAKRFVEACGRFLEAQHAFEAKAIASRGSYISSTF